MPPIILKPNLDLMREEYVLVQAWKKTSSYIRYHNWFADTLALDWATVNLPSFIGEIAERLESLDSWENQPLRIVPAPKSQPWHIADGSWKPPVGKNRRIEVSLRPLAHVNLQEQVIATALMLCLANRVETEQGDPREKIDSAHARQKVISYGNRLFCDTVNKELHHRWGSRKLYRSYYQDYQKFLSRPETVARSVDTKNGARVFIVHLDLSKFYDRVRPNDLTTALRRIPRDDDDDDVFHSFAEKFFNWAWAPDDKADIDMYSKQAGIDDFSKIALPQGLVASGFFSNVVLLSFDECLREEIGTKIEPGICLEDVCRYVDDMRVVVSVESNDCKITEVEKKVFRHLERLLKSNAPFLEIHESKTKIFEFDSDEHPPIRQSAKMRRIQSAVSGGFDATGGVEIIESIQGLMKQTSRHGVNKGMWDLSPLPDVRDTTVWRFSAGRFRSTYRSIRPLLETENIADSITGTTEYDENICPLSLISQKGLDDDARAFALDLVELWIKDPSNVRLLRIGLDIRPDPKILQEVLKLLRPFTQNSRRAETAKRVAWYCLSELLRAGATETGLVEDDERLPNDIDFSEYRAILCKEAVRLTELPEKRIPWYLRQQALLFLATYDPGATKHLTMAQCDETEHYLKMLSYMHGPNNHIDDPDFATLAVLSRRIFLGSKRSATLLWRRLPKIQKAEIARMDPSFVCELSKDDDSGRFFEDLSMRIREDLCADITEKRENHRNLAEIVLHDGAQNFLRNELSLLHFAFRLLHNPSVENKEISIITPGQICLELNNNNLEYSGIKELKILASQSDSANEISLYSPPNWTGPNDHWRFNLGFLLRFILSGQPDFTINIRPTYWKDNVAAYQPAKSHWYQRLYGLFNGQPAFGDDWVPITEWMENFMLALLAWPGCGVPKKFRWIEGGINEAVHQITKRIEKLEQRRDGSIGTLMMPIDTIRPTKTSPTRPLRACVVQTVIPAENDFSADDLTLSSPNKRKKYRNHLSATLAAVKRSLVLRATHEKDNGYLDWLILPELAVHPRDVYTHLVPFARAHKTLILAGLTYEELLPGKKLVNSALWIMPTLSKEGDLQIRFRRQGKLNLTSKERDLSPHLVGFRPCQWLIGYPWSDSEEPLWLTASICYDATDLELTAKLRNQSDVLAIPALNKDVKTFDHMALALHYHMFQLVIVANNGTYGGSNAYQPMKADHERQIFHLHGQPQASIAFLEIDVSEFLKRGKSQSSEKWKTPPAGWKCKN